MRRRVEIRVDGSLAVVRGWQAQSLALSAGLKPIYLGTVQGWTFDASKLPTYCAYLDYRGISYTIEDEEPRDVLRTFPEEVSESADVDLELPFGGDAA